MTTVRELYEGVRDRLKTVGLKAYDYVPGTTEMPAAMMMPPMVEHEGLSDDWATLRFEVFVLVSGSIDEKQRRLLEYQDFEGPKSISAAFRADPTLGIGVDVRVTRSRPVGFEEMAGYQVFGSVFEFVARLG